MKNRVFVVEDNPDIREIVTFLLEQNGLKVESFECAGPFLDLIASQAPDLIILDVMLPDGNGIDICKSLKENKKTEDIPVIIMSASANAAAASEAKAAGFISKPFDINSFINSVKLQIPGNVA